MYVDLDTGMVVEAALKGRAGLGQVAYGYERPVDPQGHGRLRPAYGPPAPGPQYWGSLHSASIRGSPSIGVRGAGRGAGGRRGVDLVDPIA